MQRNSFSFIYQHLGFGFLDARGRVSLKGFAEEAANAKRLFQEVALGGGRERRSENSQRAFVMLSSDSQMSACEAL